MSQETETFEIILGRVEHINASHFNCLSFAKASDMANGINVRLSNMAGGYPFSFGGVTWRDSETLYLCGEFSDSSEKHLLVQEDMQRQTSGFAAKRFIKKRNSNLIRQDFADFRIQWMLYVIWQKCKGNADFANLLLKLPHDAIIIEISKAALKRIVNSETCKVNGIGTFVGQNNLGKILMICRDCLIQGVEPPIDYALLNRSNIYILGRRLSFPTDKTSMSN
uniref:NADAR family protein n=1 Tax=Prevotella sp. TaxID=59823 RepID=UPI004024ED29